MLFLRPGDICIMPVGRSDGVCALHRLAAHCYARRITQADLRAAMRPISEPTPGTEPPYPRFAAHLRCVSAKEGKGSQEGAREPYGALVPFCPCRGHGILRPPKAANGHAHFERKVASSGEPLYRRKVYPLLRVRRRGRRGLPDRRFLTLKKIFGVFSKKRLTLSLAYANLYTG